MESPEEFARKQVLAKPYLANPAPINQKNANQINGLRVVQGGLNTLLIELTNLGRATDFQQVNVEFAQGKIGVARAAHNKERVEYGTIEEMSRYYSEARPEIEAAGYGNPSLWYMASDAYTGVPSPSYQSFEDYYAVARNSGHTDVYTDFYTRWKNSMESSD